MANITHVGDINSPLCQLQLKLKLLRAWGTLQAPVNPGESADLLLFLWTTGVINDQHDIDAVGLQ